MKKPDQLFKYFIYFISSISIISLLAIIFFLVSKSIPVFQKYSILDFLTKADWNPSDGRFGILSFILTSIIVTILSVLIALPIGIYSALFIQEVLPKKIANSLIFVIEILAGIPSVIYGFFGLIVIAPQVSSILNLSRTTGVLIASIVLAMMILPNLIVLTIASLSMVDDNLKSSAFALGANKVQVIFKIQFFHAKSGIIAAIFLSLARSLGETMAVVLVAGNSIAMPNWSNFLTYSGRTLTANIVQEASYASGLHLNSLYATGVVLFIFVSIINYIVLKIKQKEVKKWKRQIIIYR